MGSMKRRTRLTLLVIVGIIITFLLWRYSNLTRYLRPGGVFTPLISDVSKISVIPVKKIYYPITVEQLRDVVVNAKEPISLAGSRHSQGGQIASPNGIVIDMTGFNDVVELDAAAKLITVQSGATWKQIQEAIDPYNLSVLVMQSYNDFTLGGSLSGNVHGRTLKESSLIQTIEAIHIMLADGSMVKASRKENTDLFKAAIGGYGGIGVIVDATIKLTDNVQLERNVTFLTIDEYYSYFVNTVLKNPAILLHNAYVYPPSFEQVVVFDWKETSQTPTIPDRLQSEKTFYLRSLFEEKMITYFPRLQTMRQYMEKRDLVKPFIVYRNYEMSHRVRSLEHLFRFPTTTVLQEYFIPMKDIASFMHQLALLAQQESINILNASLRYVKKDTESLLSYAHEDSFACVLYINLQNTPQGLAKAERWTQKLIDLALSFKGTYYLPYQLYATKAQFLKAYPPFPEFMKIKKKYDPHNHFSNAFFIKYTF
jgi:FAD/FMN-containing dehydrogenase